MSVQHWKFQRISAIALVPIILFSLYYIVNLGTLPYDQLINDLGSINGFIITTLFMGFILFHSSMGMEVIIEDYVHSENLQKNIVSISKLFHIVSFFLTITILASI